MKKILFLFVAPALFAASPQYQSGEIIVPAASAEETVLKQFSQEQARREREEAERLAELECGLLGELNADTAARPAHSTPISGASRSPSRQPLRPLVREPPSSAPSSSSAALVGANSQQAHATVPVLQASMAEWPWPDETHGGRRRSAEGGRRWSADGAAAVCRA